MATVLVVAVASVVFSLPFLLHWLWPRLDYGIIAVANLFLGGVLGVIAVVCFLRWKWEL